jgi:hypothetical protein
MRYIVSNGRLNTKTHAKAMLIDAAAPQNAAWGYASRKKVNYNDRIWVYAIDGSFVNVEFVVTLQQRESSNDK